ncbi:MAG TPA: hypothetical protein VJ743_16125 [Albitalea sp.]|nr:hypothetical protein [Albitalea sp.]
MVLVLIGLYLKDCLLLLDADEATLTRRTFGRWQAGFGLRDWKLAGREPFLCNPMLPHEPVFRLAWSMSGSTKSPARRPLEPPPVLTALQPMVLATWLLLFAVLPFCVLTGMPTWFTVAAVAVLYANILASLVVLYRGRGQLDIEPGVLRLVALEIVLCPPYAANLVRKLSLAIAPDEDFLTAARRLLPDGHMAAVHRQCAARIDEAVQALPEDSAAIAGLLGHRNLLKESSHDAD